MPSSFSWERDRLFLVEELKTQRYDRRGKCHPHCLGLAAESTTSGHIVLGCRSATKAARGWVAGGFCCGIRRGSSWQQCSFPGEDLGLPQGCRCCEDV